MASSPACSYAGTSTPAPASKASLAEQLVASLEPQLGPESQFRLHAINWHAAVF
jgi:hypothetical protein